MFLCAGMQAEMEVCSEFEDTGRLLRLQTAARQ
jgi:hypothetical protein